jgi:hypothetical protein
MHVYQQFVLEQYLENTSIIIEFHFNNTSPALRQNSTDQAGGVVPKYMDTPEIHARSILPSSNFAILRSSPMHALCSGERPVLLAESALAAWFGKSSTISPCPQWMSGWPGSSERVHLPRFSNWIPVNHIAKVAVLIISMSPRIDIVVPRNRYYIYHATPGGS